MTIKEWEPTPSNVKILEADQTTDVFDRVLAMLHDSENVSPDERLLQRLLENDRNHDHIEAVLAIRMHAAARPGHKGQERLVGATLRLKLDAAANAKAITVPVLRQKRAFFAIRHELLALASSRGWNDIAQVANIGLVTPTLFMASRGPFTHEGYRPQPVARSVIEEIKARTGGMNPKTLVQQIERAGIGPPQAYSAPANDAPPVAPTPMMRMRAVGIKGSFGVSGVGVSLELKEVVQYRIAPFLVA